MTKAELRKFARERKRIVKLYDEKGKSFGEIAKLLGVSRTAVHRRYWQEKDRALKGAV